MRIRTDIFVSKGVWEKMIDRGEKQRYNKSNP